MAPLVVVDEIQQEMERLKQYRVVKDQLHKASHRETCVSHPAYELEHGANHQFRHSAQGKPPSMVYHPNSSSLSINTYSHESIGKPHEVVVHQGSCCASSCSAGSHEDTLSSSDWMVDESIEKPCAYRDSSSHPMRKSGSIPCLSSSSAVQPYSSGGSASTYPLQRPQRAIPVVVPSFPASPTAYSSSPRNASNPSSSPRQAPLSPAHRGVRRTASASSFASSASRYGTVLERLKNMQEQKLQGETPVNLDKYGEKKSTRLSAKERFEQEQARRRFKQVSKPPSVPPRRARSLSQERRVLTPQEEHARARARVYLKTLQQAYIKARAAKELAEKEAEERRKAIERPKWAPPLPTASAMEPKLNVAVSKLSGLALNHQRKRASPKASDTHPSSESFESNGFPTEDEHEETQDVSLDLVPPPHPRPSPRSCPPTFSAAAIAHGRRSLSPNASSRTTSGGYGGPPRSPSSSSYAFSFSETSPREMTPTARMRSEAYCKMEMPTTYESLRKSPRASFAR